MSSLTSAQHRTLSRLYAKRRKLIAHTWMNSMTPRRKSELAKVDRAICALEAIESSPYLARMTSKPSHPVSKISSSSTVSKRLPNKRKTHRHDRVYR